MRRALAFLTPFGGPDTPSPGALSWFPLVGALVGIAVGGVWWLAAKGWGAAPAAALAVAADLAFTGLLHFDGLADTADGLLPHLDRQRRLDVMAEPTIGGFGVAVGGAVLIIRFSAFASSPVTPVVIAGLWCASRSALAVVARTVPYARPGGIASSFLGDGDDSPAVPAIVGALLAGALCFAGRHWRGEVALGALLLSMAAVVAFGVRKLGGFTGDILGAAAVVGETVGLLVLASKW